MIDDCTRECFGLIVDTSFLGRRAVRESSQIIAQRGLPKLIVSDNGSA